MVRAIRLQSTGPLRRIGGQILQQSLGQRSKRGDGGAFWDGDCVAIASGSTREMRDVCLLNLQPPPTNDQRGLDCSADYIVDSYVFRREKFPSNGNGVEGRGAICGPMHYRAPGFEHED